METELVVSKDVRSGAVSDQVRWLYDNIGWMQDEGITFDAQSCEDLRPTSAEYVTACRRRILRHLPDSGKRLLDMASGPIQYPEYLEYSNGYKKRVCVDLSIRALDMAREKLGEAGEYLLGDFLEIDLAEDSVDAVVSLHTIYHIDALRQAPTVRKLINVTKPGGTIVIVYANPNYFVTASLAPLKRFLKSRKAFNPQEPDQIYFFRFPLDWWTQFNDVADVKIYPWRTFSTREMKSIIPGNAVGRWMLKRLFALEDCFPWFFSRVGLYPTIVLTKHLGMENGKG